jgi:hypothetical protein
MLVKKYSVGAAAHIGPVGIGRYSGVDVGIDPYEPFLCNLTKKAGVLGLRPFM